MTKPSSLSDYQDLASNLATHFRQRAKKADESGQLPTEDIQDLSSSGFLKIVIPEEYGGWAASLADITAALLELAKGSGSTSLVVAMTLHIIGHERESRSWTANIREQLFTEVAAGALLNAAASEPKLGSPSRGGLPESYAKSSADRLLVNGHKNWVTGGQHLKHLLVRLRLGDEATMVWIPADSPGIRWECTWGKGLSLRASDSHDVYFENVSLSPSHLYQQGHAPASIWFPLMMAATYLGIALESRDAVIRYALERTPTALGKPIATLPNIQRQIGELDLALGSARQYLLTTAASWQGINHEAFLAQAAAAKHLAVETALHCTDLALRIAGAAAVDTTLPLERCFRDVRAGIMHPPSGDAALELVGRAALGM